jgi:hypothetical protein
MSTTDKNPPRSEQQREAAESPLKKPETETSHAHASDVERAASAQEASLGAAVAPHGQQAREPDEPREARGAQWATGVGDPVYAAHPRGIDVVNDETLDDTVDADGKNWEAKRNDQEGWPREHAIVSQATLVNAVPTRYEGLGGFDSRPGGELPLMALRDGYEVIDHGVVPPIEQPGPISVTTMTDGGSDVRRMPYAAHRRRPERLIEIRIRREAKH